MSVKTRTLSRLNHWRTHHKSLADFIIYIIIGLAVAASLVITTLAGVSKNVILESYFFLIISVLVFGRFIPQSHRYWKSKRFWWLTAVLFFLHSGAWLYALRKIGPPPNLRSTIWVAAYFVETMLLPFVRDATLNRQAKHYLPE